MEGGKEVDGDRRRECCLRGEGEEGRDRKNEGYVELACSYTYFKPMRREERTFKAKGLRWSLVICALLFSLTDSELLSAWGVSLKLPTHGPRVGNTNLLSVPEPFYLEA